MNLSQIVSGYTSIGFTARQAVKLVVSDHLSAKQGRGKGSKAKRRQRAIEERILGTFEWSDVGLTAEDVDKMEAYYAARRPARPVAALGEF